MYAYSVQHRWSDPYAYAACLCVAAATLALLASGPLRASVAPYMRTVENMTYPTRPKRPRTRKASSTLSHVDMPTSENLVHFVTPTDDGTNCVDLVNGSQEQPFAVTARSVPRAPIWAGPSAKSMMSTESEQAKVSVFVTLDGSMDTASVGTAIGARASLFLAYASDRRNTTRGVASEKWVQLAVHGLASRGHELRATFGDDVAAVEFPPTSHPRTVFMVRNAQSLRVGYFDPTGTAEDGASTDSRQGPLLMSEQPVMINATGAQIGGIISLVVYQDSVQDVVNQVRAGIARHTLLNNSHYREVRETVMNLNDEIDARKKQPRYAGAGVADACADITDWTAFDPVLATSACRDAIRESCEDDPSQKHCRCWDDSFELKESVECAAMRAVFGADGETIQAPATCAGPESPPAAAVPLPPGKSWLSRPSWLTSVFRPS